MTTKEVMSAETQASVKQAVSEMLADTGLQALTCGPDGNVMAIHPDLDGYMLRFSINRPIVRSAIMHGETETPERFIEALGGACDRARRSLAQDLRALADRMDPK